LTAQVRRASASIPANIAEGSGRGGDPDFARFLRIAIGSAAELEYHLLLAHDLNYLGDKDYQQVAESTDEVKKMLRRLLERIATHDDSRLATRDS
jgi:four helix bundle protein